MLHATCHDRRLVEPFCLYQNNLTVTLLQPEVVLAFGDSNFMRARYFHFNMPQRAESDMSALISQQLCYVLC